MERAKHLSTKLDYFVHLLHVVYDFLTFKFPDFAWPDSIKFPDQIPENER